MKTAPAAVIAAIVLIGSLLAPAEPTYSGGDGSSVTPFQIADVNDFLALSATSAHWDKHFILTADIAFDPNNPAHIFTQAPIAPTSSPSFIGVFDGGGNTVSNLTINAAGKDYIGLLGYVGQTGQVQNLGIENANLIGGSYVGVLVGYNDQGVIINCNGAGAVNGHSVVGGLCGLNKSGNITNCYAVAMVTGTGHYTGGLCGGNNSGIIKNSYASGAVSGPDGYVGGLCGQNYNGSIINCYATGNVTGASFSGGLCGHNFFGSIANSYATGIVSGTGYFDGLCGGNSSGTITNCYLYCFSGPNKGYGESLDDFGLLEASNYIGFDFAGNSEDGIDDDWTIVNGHCPKLSWQVDDGPSAPFLLDDISTTLSGSGYVNNPFVISDFNDLMEFRNNTALRVGYYILTDDIDLSGQTYSPSFIPEHFNGYFDGAGHVISNATVNGENNVGFFSTLSGNVVNFGLVNVNVNGTGNNAGGLIGYLYSGNITRSYSTGTVSGYSCVGGLCGRNDSGNFTNSYSTGAVSGTGNSVGGLCGIYYFGNIINCYATGAVSGANNYIGGLCGYYYSGSIEGSYATGTVSGGKYVGGLCGLWGYDSFVSIANSYATGAVSGTGNCVGGLCGLCGCNSSGYITDSYAIGAVNGADYVGGLCGRNNLGTVTNSFWDIETSGLMVSDGGIGLTTLAMKTKSNYVSAGWNFSSTWGICNGYDYPYLEWEGCTGPCLDISSDNLAFEIPYKNIKPADQIVAIHENCKGLIDWFIDLPSECDWLSVSPLSNNSDPNITDITVSIDPAYAKYGLNTCEFTVRDSNAINSPKTVTVTLNVLRPTIAVSPASVGFNVEQTMAATQVLAISNSGYDTLNWQISEDCGWLSVAPSAGQCVAEADEVTLTVNTEGLDVGTYSCNLTITDGNASNSPMTVPVSLHVYRAGERHVPLEYTTIQAAIDAAVTGDHVIIHPGRYSASKYTYIYFKGKAVTVRSIEPDNPEIVSSTILDNMAFLFYQNEGRSSILDGLTLRGTVNCHNNTSPVIRNCVFSLMLPPTGDHSYSLISASESNPYIQNCTFVGIKRGQRMSPAITINNNRNTIDDTIIENCLLSLKNSFATTFGTVPLINVDQGHVIIKNTTIAYCFLDNSTSSSIAPGISIRESDVLLTNSIIWGNRGSNDTQIIIVNRSDTFDDPLNSRVDVSYSNIEGGQEKVLLFPDNAAFSTYQQNGTLPDPNLIDPATLTWGPGNMDADPLFVREPDDGGDGWFPVYTPTGWDYSQVYNNDYGDFHLKSEAGRFVWEGFARADFNLDRRVDLADFAELARNWGVTGTSNLPIPCNLYYDGTIDVKDLLLFCEDYLRPRVFGTWVTDEVTSPCIDVGEPADAGWQGELWPHGGRVNMGAYGGTAQASLSGDPVGNIADLNHDGVVDLADWSPWAEDWLVERMLLASDFDRNAVVDVNDLEIFLNNWMVGN